MSIQYEMNSEDILNSIDINKINMSDKKKRGRPKKTLQMAIPNSKIKYHSTDNINYEDEEIILHLPIFKSDIIALGIDFQDGVFIGDDANLNIDQSDNSDEESDDKSEKNHAGLSQADIINKKQFHTLIKRLKDENDELRKYLHDITPMYFTEVKVYPINLKLFDIYNNQLIPIKTDIHCWWCTYQFDCLPTYLPEKIIDNKFNVRGCFCSFNCAGAYNLNLNDNKKWDRLSLLKQMYYAINKDKINQITDIEINVSGPKELLEKYGGNMTIEDYRKNSKILGREYHELLPPFLPIAFGFEETTNSKTNKNTNNNSLFNLSKIDNIIIKRNKPLNNIASKHIDNYID